MSRSEIRQVGKRPGGGGSPGLLVAILGHALGVFPFTSLITSLIEVVRASHAGVGGKPVAHGVHLDEIFSSVA